MARPVVTSVGYSPVHGMTKPAAGMIRLLAGLGVEGDAHAGLKVRHLSRVARDPDAPNLRQVHLIASELFDELSRAGIPVAPGMMGENLTTRGLDLIALPRGACLHLGSEAIVEITGLRNPCKQLDGIARGLMKATLGRDAKGNLVRKAGIMSIVREGGEVRPDDPIRVVLPPTPHRPLEVV